MSNNIYTDRVPYTYLIYTHITDQYYYGSRTAKGCHPDDLWTLYFTSSKQVKKIILEYGTEAFTVVHIATHNTIKDALNFEADVLTKNNVIFNSRWLNQSIKGGIFERTPEMFAKGIETKRRNGTINSMTVESIAKSKATKELNGTNGNNSTADSIARQVASRRANKGYTPSDVTKNKIRETLMLTRSQTSDKDKAHTSKKISAALKGKKKTPQHIENARVARKAKQLERATEKFWLLYNNEIGINRSSIYTPSL